MTDQPLIGKRNLHLAAALDPFDGCRRPQVIQQRLVACEAVDAHQLFVIERSVGLAELGVTLVRQPSKLEVVAHTRFPRRACSRSIASNSDLKFPSPKPREPWRSITSKNTVGRS